MRAAVQWVMLALLLAGIAVFGLLSRQVYFLQLMSVTGIFALVAVGLNLLVGSAGQISLGQAGFFGVGAYTSALLLKFFHLPFVLGLVAGTFSAAVLGALVGYAALRLRGHYLAMATLAFGAIVFGLLEQFEFTGGANGLLDIPGVSLFGVAMSTPVRVYWVIWTVTGLVFGGVLSLQYSRVGRALTAVRDDEVAAATLGIPVAWLKIQVFTLAAALAGLAGGLYASYLTALIPSAFGIMTSMDLLIMVVVGGLGNVPGTILGVTALTILPEFGRQWEEYRLAAYGVVLVLLVLLFPGGLGDLVERLILRLSPILGKGQGQ